MIAWSLEWNHRRLSPEYKLTLDEALCSFVEIYSCTNEGMKKNVDRIFPDRTDDL